MSVRLPDNPEARSRKTFTFDNGPDVLTYSHDVVCHLTDLAEVTTILLEV